MPALSPWNLDPTRLLTRRELAAVLADLAPRARRFANVQRNLIVVRLACCCELRVSEIAALQLDDVVVDEASEPGHWQPGHWQPGRGRLRKCIEHVHRSSAETVRWPD